MLESTSPFILMKAYRDTIVLPNYMKGSQASKTHQILTSDCKRASLNQKKYISLRWLQMRLALITKSWDFL